MKTKRLKGNILNKILITLILLVLVSTLILTLAYFQDKKEYSGTLDFGNIKLKVSGGVEGDGVTTSTSKLIFDTARKKNNDPTWTGKYMPGDLVEINLIVDLEVGSEPAYYVVQISDEKNIFENNIYFSEDGQNVYVYNGTYTYKQDDSTKTMVEDKYCGKITAGNAQNLTISAKISEDYETQNEQTTVYCKIFAIQQANLEPQKAVNLMPTGYVNVPYKNWAIAYSTGNVYDETRYFATSAYISVDGFEKFLANTTLGYDYTFYCYDSQFEYLGTGLSGGYITKDKVLDAYSNAAYFSIEINKSSVSGYETKTLEDCLRDCGIKIYGNCEVIERSI